MRISGCVLCSCHRVTLLLLVAVEFNRRISIIRDNDQVSVLTSLKQKDKGFFSHSLFSTHHINEGI